MQLTHASLFSGIGGFDLAADWMGWGNVFHCEIDAFCRQILNYYWPEAIAYHDIITTDFTIHQGSIDVLTGGFPCQPFSLAGARKGTNDNRHLWPEMLRAIREIQPAWVVGENVYGIVNWGRGLVFDQVQADMEAAGYQVQPVILPACALNAPHRRDRVWFIAHNASYARCLIGDGRQNIQCDGIEYRQNRPGDEAADQFGGPCETGADPDTGSQHGAISKQQRHKGPADINTCGDAKSELIANTASELDRWPGREEKFNQREEPEQKGNKLRHRLNTDGESRDITDTDKSGQQELPVTGFSNAQGSYSGLFIENWDNWPTQSPVCIGDDGISARLDLASIFKSIKPRQTRPRWRNLSLKAGGNAVVPQIPHQIFITIEKYIAQYAR